MSLHVLKQEVEIIKKGYYPIVKNACYRQECLAYEKGYCSVLKKTLPQVISK